MADNDYADPEHALAYLAIADGIPHRVEGEAVLVSFIPAEARRILDLGTGDGRLLSLLALKCVDAELVGIDSSPTMLEAARHRFAENPRATIRHHDLDDQLPDLGTFDAIVSSFAIHHCSDPRKRSLYAEVFAQLTPGGVFCNLEHVASPSPMLHRRFLDALGMTADQEDAGNILLDVHTQLDWLRDIGFAHVDCHWKWLELALLGGLRC